VPRALPRDFPPGRLQLLSALAAAGVGSKFITQLRTVVAGIVNKAELSTAGMIDNHPISQNSGKKKGWCLEATLPGKESQPGSLHGSDGGLIKGRKALYSESIQDYS